MDCAGVFAEALDALGALQGSGEMEVGELGDGVTEAVVDLSERAVAAVDVGDDAM